MNVVDDDLPPKYDDIVVVKPTTVPANSSVV